MSDPSGVPDLQQRVSPMIDHGKRNVVGVLVDAVDYDAAVARVIAAARNRQSLTVSALAVHGVMTGVLDPEHRHRLNRFALIVPDGQPVRWGLNLLHKAGLRDRVYGPTLTLKVCERAAAENIPIYLYGSRPQVLTALQAKLCETFPTLRIAGSRPSLFRRATPEEKQQIAAEIRASGAGIVLVGLGCPRQEVWAYEYRMLLPMPLLAVGAAFDFHAGLLPQAPPWMQRKGLEWVFRLVHEPRRLWRRYVYLNPCYAALLALQALRIKHFDPDATREPRQECGYA